MWEENPALISLTLFYYLFTYFIYFTLLFHYLNTLKKQNKKQQSGWHQSEQTPNRIFLLLNSFIKEKAFFS